MSRTPALWGFPRVLAVVALTAVGCGDDGDSQLVKIDQEPPGDTCPNGGVILRVGTDEDGDGELTGDEVTASEVICHGGGGEGTTDSLVRTTEIPEGDEGCPYGGVRIEAGLDDGAGGGTAGDGELQDGEVDDVLVVCNGQPSVLFGSLEPPAGPAGKYTLQFDGGDGTACGGHGGRFNLTAETSLRGGHLKVFPTGEADASFTVPSPRVDLGSNPVDITRSTTLEVLADSNCDGVPDDTSGLSTGALYQIDCDSASGTEEYIWRWTGSTAAPTTGLRVAPGVTLTLGLNRGAGVTLRTGAVLLEGVLTAAAHENGGRWMELRVEGNFVSKPGARIDLRSDGPNASSFELDVDLSVVNQGDIDVSGADAPGVIIESGGIIWNTGNIDASGGAPADGPGGWGGYIWFDTFNGSIFNSGALTARGADATNGEGGEGGSVGFETSSDIVNRGRIDVRGGNASAGCVESCDGGSAAVYAAYFMAGGRVVNNADIIARGGDGADGGDGGGVVFYSVGSGGILAAAAPTGRAAVVGGRPFTGVEVSGNIDVRGGRGRDGHGGSGGSIEAIVSDGGEGSLLISTFSGPRRPSEIVFYGYDALSLNGGAGDDTCDGGDGGEVVMFHPCTSDPRTMVPGGGVALLTDVSAKGGAGSGEAYGGDGGSVRLVACTYPNPAYSDVQVALLDGDFDLSGGSATGAPGGDGGEAILYASDAVEIVGSLKASGGDGVGVEGIVAGGGFGGWVVGLGTSTRVGLHADIDARGGKGVGNGAYTAGGRGGLVGAGGLLVENTGRVQVDGGSGPAAGGDGGEVMFASFGGTTVNTGTVTAAGGASANEPGEPGMVEIDGIIVTP